MTSNGGSTAPDGMNDDSVDADLSYVGSGSGNSVISGVAKTSRVSLVESDRFSVANGHTASSPSHAFANKGRKAQSRLRILMVFLFLVAVVMVPLFIFQTTSSGETQNFENDYEGLALKVLASVDDSIRKIFSAIDSIDVAVTSYAVGSQSRWPYVTVPDFDIKAANILALADSSSVFLLPIVRESERSAYEEYSVENLGWLDIAFSRGTFQLPPPAAGRNRHRKMQEQDNTGASTSNPLLSSVHPFIWDDLETTPAPSKGGGDSAKKLYFPVWENAAPPVPSLINYDFASHPSLKGGILSAVETQKAVISEIIKDTTLIQDYFDSSMGANKSEAKASESPVSMIYYPVFDQFGPNATLVAVLGMTIDWQDLFADVSCK